MNNSNNFSLSALEAIIFAALAVIIGQILAGVIILPVALSPQLEFLNHLLFPLSFAIGFGAAALALLKLKNLDWQFVKITFAPKPSWIIWIILILFYIASLPTVEYLSTMVPTGGDGPIGQFLEKFYEFYLENFEMILNYKVAAFIMVCLLAPLLEEFIFRGFILNGMLKHGVHPTWAILLSAFLFGIAHLNPWQFVGAGFLGIIFAYVFYRTRSLWACIFLHFLHNTISYVLSMYYGFEEVIFEPNYYMVAASILGLIIFGIILYKTTSNGTDIRHA